MAQIVDVRGSGGSLVILGGALGLPTQNTTATSVQTGSIRYNAGSSVLEVFTGSGSDGGWSPATGSGSGVISFNGRTGGISLTSTDVISALGYTPLGASAVKYTQLPPSLNDIPFVYTNPGLQPINQQVWTIPVVIPFKLYSTFTGSAAIAGVPATTNSSFALTYIRSGVSTAICTITFAAGASVASFTGGVGYQAVVGDIIVLTSPPIQDRTLGNVGIIIIGSRTDST
jgi:hypothetical protein